MALYSSQLEKKVKYLPFKSSRLRLKTRMLSTNRVLVSRPEIKHTNDKAIVTIYVYNRHNKYYLNKLNKVASIDKIDNLLPNYTKNRLNSNGL